MGTPKEHILGSHCCEAPTHGIERVEEKQTYGTAYYYHRCEKCGKPCARKLLRLFDCAGFEVLPGDVVECPAVPENHSGRYHCVRMTSRGLDLRDGNNNCGMYDMDGDYFTRGPYWMNLDKLSDDDLDYYWHTTRKKAEKKAARKR